MTAPTSTRRSNKLPDAAGRFPIAPFDQAARAMKVWDAWYTGDADALHTFYASEFGPTRPIQYRSGFRGRLARFFWGRPANQATKRLHVPAPADLARTSADLLFSQPPRFVMGEDDASSHKTAQDRLEKLLGGPDTAAALLEAGEVQSALGGSYLKLWWDEDVSDKIELSPVHADCAIPTFRYGKLAAVTFWTIVHVDDQKGVYRHLERHSPGAVEHGLYKGSAEVLGNRIPLQALPATEWVAEISDDGVIPTGVEGITAAYAPNVRPNRMWRNTPGLASLGRSDFEGLEPLFDALDDAWSSWMRDLDLGKGRIFIDENMLANNGPGRSATFDVDQEVYTRVRGLGKMADGGNISMSQFAIRWNEHSQTCAEILNSILRGAGYSAANFSDDMLSVTKTATEIESRDRLSERTRDKKINYWKAALQPLATTMIQLDHEVFGTDFTIKDAPEVRFPLRPQANPQAMAGTLSQLRASNLLSIEQGIRERNPNWSGDDVNDEVERIKKEIEQQMGVGATPDGGQQYGDEPQYDDYSTDEPG